MGRVCMQGGDAARMAGIPGLQHVECLGAADFADNDPVGAQAQGRADEVRKRHRSGLRTQLHGILCC